MIQAAIRVLQLSFFAHTGADPLNRNGNPLSSRGGRGGRSLQPSSSFNTPRGRGRGRGGDRAPNGRGLPGWSLHNGPRGRGRGRGDDRGTPTGPTSSRGRGIGYDNPGLRMKLNPDAPLSALLYASRPLLRPIKFVPSIHTRTLFEEIDDIIQPTAVDIGWFSFIKFRHTVWIMTRRT